MAVSPGGNYFANVAFAQAEMSSLSNDGNLNRKSGSEWFGWSVGEWASTRLSVITILT